MKEKWKKITGRKSFRIILGIIIVLVIFLIFFFLNWEKKEELTDEALEGNLVEEEDNDNISTSDNGNTEQNNDETVTDAAVDAAGQSTGQNASSKRFENAAYGYSIAIPDGFEVKSDTDVIYLRNTAAKTQLAIFYLPGTYADGVDVWEDCNNYMYKMTALLTDSEGVTEEKTVANYGAGFKNNISIGNYTVSQELGELWFRNTGDPHNIVLDECAYYTTFNGNGIAIVGISQSEDTSTVFGYMREVLSSLSSYTATSGAQEMTRFSSTKADGTIFSYPTGWKVSEYQGMTIIGPGENQSDANAGFYITFYADTEDIVTDYAQFSRAMEQDILHAVFITEVQDRDFTYTSSVTHMDLNARIGEKPCIYYEITDNIFPKSSAVRQLIGINGNSVECIRYCYSAGGLNCFVNFILPNDNCKELCETIMSTFSSN